MATLLALRRVALPQVAFATRQIFTAAPCLAGMNCFGTSRANNPPLLPQGLDPRERHHCGPSKFIGKTPVDIIARFKDTSAFPWYMVPLPLRNRRFEELWQLAHRTGHKAALQVVRVLMDERHDRDPHRPALPAAGLASATTSSPRLNRSARKALRSGVPASEAIRNGPAALHH